MSRLIKIPKNKLELLYFNKELSRRRIAEEFNCSKSTILERLHRYNIPVREKKKMRIEIPKIDYKNSALIKS